MKGQCLAQRRVSITHCNFWWIRCHCLTMRHIKRWHRSQGQCGEPDAVHDRWCWRTQQHPCHRNDQQTGSHRQGCPKTWMIRGPCRDWAARWAWVTRDPSNPHKDHVEKQPIRFRCKSATSFHGAQELYRRRNWGRCQVSKLLLSKQAS